MAGGINSLLPYLHARDVTILLVSRAPLERLQAYKRRMGWSIPWASTASNDFNSDLGAQLIERVGWAVTDAKEVEDACHRRTGVSGEDVAEESMR
jgi:predicted dithiol-disulfide oxidoreductase (DUF899 family)